MDPFLGQIIAFGGTFAPRGWAFCQGQLLSITSNTALFSILGVQYGGDGVSTFGLPDLRGRAIIGAGQGPGLANYTSGNMGGVENVTLTQAQLPAHTHTASAQPGRGSSATPAGNMLAVTVTTATPPAPVDAYAPSSAGAATAMGPMIGSTGGSQAIPTRSPYTCINYIIALQGIYPTRS